MVTRPSTGTDSRPKVARRHTQYRVSKSGEVLSYLELSHKQPHHLQKTWSEMTRPRGKFFVSFVESDGVTCLVQLLKERGAHQHERICTAKASPLKMGDIVVLFPGGQFRIVSKAG